jgi:hypothetical protein
MSGPEATVNGAKPGFFVSNFGVPLVLSSLKTTSFLLLGGIKTDSTSPEQSNVIDLIRNAENTSFGLRVTYWLCVTLTAGLLHLVTFICMQISLRRPKGSLFQIKQTLADSIQQNDPYEMLCDALFEEFPKEGIECHIGDMQTVTVRNSWEFLEKLIAYTYYTCNHLHNADGLMSLNHLLSQKNDFKSSEEFIIRFILGMHGINSEEPGEIGITTADIFAKFVPGKRPEEILKVKDEALKQTSCWKQLTDHLTNRAALNAVENEIYFATYGVSSFINRILQQTEYNDMSGLAKFVADRYRAEFDPVSKISEGIITLLPHIGASPVPSFIMGNLLENSTSMCDIFNKMGDCDYLKLAVGMSRFTIPEPLNEIRLNTIEDVGKIFGFAPNEKFRHASREELFNEEVSEEIATLMSNVASDYENAINTFQFPFEERSYTLSEFALEMLARNHVANHRSANGRDKESFKEYIKSLYNRRAALLAG